MWAYRLEAPGRVRQIEVPEETTALSDGQVRLRVRIAGLCGSDMPRFNAVVGRLASGTGEETAPVHEVVGDVVESSSPDLPIGQRVVGTLGPEAGLAEIITASDSMLIAVPDGLSDVEAIVIQPLATVLRAAAHFPPVEGVRAAVIGAGPAGLLICHVLRKRGASYVCAVDPVERRETALAFGADEFFHMTSAGWLTMLNDADRPHIVVEAVGHQQATIRDAMRAAARHGFVYGFGAPDDSEYVIPYGELYDKDLRLGSGRTWEWHDVLQAGARYLLEHRADLSALVSHVIPAADAQQAYALYARPQHGRLKVVIQA